MNILQVVARYYPNIGGLEEHVRNISECLSIDNLVTVATTDPKGNLPREETINRVIVKRFKSWAPYETYYFSNQLSKYLSKQESLFDVVHAHGYHSIVPFYASQSKKLTQGFFFTAHYHGSGHTPLRKLLHKPYRLL